jgi:hypothetical protein
MMLSKTYTVRGDSGTVLQFKYALNGILIFYQVIDGELTEKLETFLFREGKFPWKEDHIKTWAKQYTKVQIEVGEPNLEFEVFWKMYPANPLSKKKIAKERFDKLSKADKIKLLMKIPEYKKLKQKEGTAYPYAEVFINQRWWDS